MIRYNKNLLQPLDVRDIWMLDDRVIRSLVFQALRVNAEGFVDMMLDHPHEYGDKAEMERALTNGVLEDAQVSIMEILDEIRLKVKTYMDTMRYEARVRELHYTLDGQLEDIVVDLSLQDVTAAPEVDAPRHPGFYTESL